VSVRVFRFWRHFYRKIDQISSRARCPSRRRERGTDPLLAKLQREREVALVLEVGSSSLPSKVVLISQFT